MLPIRGAFFLVVVVGVAILATPLFQFDIDFPGDNDITEIVDDNDNSHIGGGGGGGGGITITPVPEPEPDPEPEDPEPEPEVSPYDYIVGSNLVTDAAGETAYTAASFNTALNWALSQSGKTTYVPAGTYDVTSSIYLYDDVTLYGDGNGTDGTIIDTSSSIYANSVSNVTVKDLRIVGGGSLEFVTTQDGADAANLTAENVTILNSSTSHAAAFLCYARMNATINWVNYTNCVVEGGDTYGFGLFGNGKSATSGGTEAMRSADIWVRNVTLSECRATDCGLEDTRRNLYVCGFDLSENANVENIYVNRCTAINNWMDGFHVENACHVYNMVLDNCTSNLNGHCPTDGTGESSPGNCSHTNGYRYSLVVAYGEASDITLVNCNGYGNKEGDVFDYTQPVYDLNPTG